MAKKHWIYIKRGLSESPKHRDAMGNRIWLFMHIIDRADWETGIVHEWKDKDEAEDMGIPQRTLQQQRQELQELGYITSQSKGHYLRITIHKWINPKDYSGKVLNLRGESTENTALSNENESTVQSTENTVVSKNESTVQSTVQTTVESTVQPIADLRTPSSNSKIIDHRSMDEWMNDDPICKFLMTLPGFNPILLESTRLKIVTHNYDLEELPYIWADCDGADNPIGMFTYKVSTGVHSEYWRGSGAQEVNEGISHPDFDRACAYLRENLSDNYTQAAPVLLEVDEKPNRMLIKLATLPAGFIDAFKFAISQASRRSWSVSFETPSTGREYPYKPIEKPERAGRPASNPDDSVTRPLPGHKEMTPEMAWSAALGELQLEMAKATFDTWIKPTVLLSVNGSWQIGTPSKYSMDWLDGRIYPTVKRILSGIVGQPVTIEFVVMK